MGRREEKKAATRRRLLDLSRSIVEEEGWEAFTIRTLASAAGVAVGTVYNYFPTKEALLLDEIESRMQRARDAMSGAVDLAEPPVQNLATIYCILLEELGENPVYLRLLLQGMLEGEGEVAERLHDMQDGFVDYLTRVVELMAAQAPEEQCRNAARGIHAMWLALLPRRLSGVLEEEAFLEEHLSVCDLVLRGLGN